MVIACPHNASQKPFHQSSGIDLKISSLAETISVCSASHSQNVPLFFHDPHKVKLYVSRCVHCSESRRHKLQCSVSMHCCLTLTSAVSSIAFNNAFVVASISCDEQHFDERSFPSVGISRGTNLLFSYGKPTVLEKKISTHLNQGNVRISLNPRSKNSRDAQQ